MMSQSIDLTNCDREKIHLVGAVQPHGFFFAFRAVDRTIYHCSENASDFFGAGTKSPAGKTLGTFFGEAMGAALMAAADKVAVNEPQFLRIGELKGMTGPFEIYLFEFDELIGVEIEPFRTVGADELNDLGRGHRRNRSFLDGLNSDETLASIATRTCQSIRERIGFDRVMMYRYFPNWDGEVIAEDKSAEAHSFLQHRFPATDIPLPARELYLKNRSRLIVDSASAPVRVEPNIHYMTRKPLDLSHSKLRAVSPVHMEYLRNMGVVSSFSVAVILRGELWGLIACHNKTPTVIPFETRLACEDTAATFAVLADIKQEVAVQRKKIGFEEGLRGLFRKLVDSPALISSLMKENEALQGLFEASGIALVSDKAVELSGLTPPTSFIQDISFELKKICRSRHRSVVSFDCLAQLDAKFSVLKELSCGVLGLYLPAQDSVFMIFRPEVIRTITWGGDPRKTMEKRNYAGVINPRKSFESWNEIVSGHSAPWESYQLTGLQFLGDFVFNGLEKKEKLLQELAKKASLV